MFDIQILVMYEQALMKLVLCSSVVHLLVCAYLPVIRIYNEICCWRSAQNIRIRDILTIRIALPYALFMKGN